MSTKASKGASLPSASLHLIPSPHYLTTGSDEKQRLFGKIPLPPVMTSTRYEVDKRWGHSRKSFIMIITNKDFGLGLQYGTSYPGPHSWLPVVIVAQGQTDFHHFSSQTHPSSTEKSQSAGCLWSKAPPLTLPPRRQQRFPLPGPTQQWGRRDR